MPREPQFVLWDIETSHNLVAAFRLLNQEMLPYENIVQERYIICGAWKVLGQSPIRAVAVAGGSHPTDLPVVEALHGVLSRADGLIHHNGSAFDLRFLETRIVFHGLPPLPPIPQIDTLLVAKGRFLFNSNSLDYLGRFLRVGRKAHTSPGLWLRVLRGEPRAIRDMVRYNKQDVALLERVFLKLRPYAQTHLNRHLLLSSHRLACPRCGSLRTQARGTYHALTRSYRRWHCTDCGGWFRDTRATPLTSTSTRPL